MLQVFHISPDGRISPMWVKGVRGGYGSQAVQETRCMQSCLAAICLTVREQVAFWQLQEAVGRRQGIWGCFWHGSSIHIPLVPLSIVVWNRGGYIFSTQEVG